MKFLKILALSFLFSSSLYADNTCWSYGNNMFYTHFWKNDIYPGWGTTLYAYYDDSPKVYSGAYATSVLCGEINVNYPGTWTAGSKACFIKIGGTITQGLSGTIDYTNFNTCPIDDYVPLLLLAICVCVFFRIYLPLREANWR